ncbi:MAG: UDP-N-acetylmuramoyl-L-alanyl-D-glutamate--2,6-diaminopimelate ligase [Acidobacteria bacterium]|nr:UDP-N-acetylmuramoyl-L-alanyl-D-glutamate--2,6-diaminopimelate ligase [Acidobacteriota bacterium]
MLLRTALEQIPGIDTTGIPDVHIQGVSYDSRACREGHLFVAMKGEKADGACFVKQAAIRGAAAVAAEHPVAPAENFVAFTVPDARKFLADISRIFHQDPASKLKLVAVTGTNGKTTTTYLIDSIFRRTGLRSCLGGTIAMKTAAGSIQSRHTTPESPDLMQFLHLAATEGCTHGSLEVSSHALVFKRVFGMKFRVGVFMNLTRDHLDFHRDIENYYSAKRLLFSPENRNNLESAVINTDDPYGKKLKDYFDGSVLSFGFNPEADIHVLDYKTRADGTDLILATPMGEAVFETGLIGRHNVYNVMAATGAALCLQIDLEEIRDGIESMQGVPGRFERVDAGQDFTVIVDYAHTPDALENLLTLAAQLPHEKILTVFGCGGDRDKSKRPIMGSIAVDKSDLSIVTSDNPRSENPLDIIKDIETGMHEGTGIYRIVPDRREAIELAVGTAGKGDIVVIAGKGHEDYQIVGGSRNPFDDRQVARESLSKLLKEDG